MAKNSMSKRSRRSFTLVEILAVMAIIALLMGLVLGTTTVANRMIRESRTKAIVSQIKVALENYKAKYGYYIQSRNGNGIADKFYLDIVETTTPPDDRVITNNFCQFIDYPLMSNDRSSMTDSTGRFLIDGYRQPLVYRCPGFFNRNGFDIGSIGEDGKLGSNTVIRKGNADFYEYKTKDTEYQADFGLGDDISNFIR